VGGVDGPNTDDGWFAAELLAGTAAR